MSLSEQPALIDLRSEINSRQCVAFVGAGLSTSCGMPLWVPFLEQLIEELEKHLRAEKSTHILAPSRLPAIESALEFVAYAGDCVKEGRLPTAASAIRAASTAFNSDWLLKRISSIFKTDRFTGLDRTDPRYTQTEERIRALLAIPWAGIVTTNYDRLIEHMSNRLQQPFGTVCDATRDNLGRVLRGSSRKPFLVYLHGHAESESVVLAEEDYDILYAQRSVEYFLRALLMRHTVVFIGTQVDDEIVRLKKNLCTTYRKHGRELEREYVILPLPSGAKRGHYLQATMGFSDVYYEASKNHLLLTELLASLSSEPRKTVQRDVVNKVLIDIIRTRQRVTYSEILKAFDQHKISGWTEEQSADLDDVSTDEVFFRLYYLVNEGFLNLNQEHETYGLGTRILAD